METVLSGPGNTFCTLTDNILRAGSPDFERVWRVLTDGSLLPLSFLDRSAGLEWVVPGTSATAYETAEPIALEALPRRSAVEVDSLVASLRVSGVAYRLQIFPTVRGVRIERQAGSTAMEQPISESAINNAPEPTGIEVDEPVASTTTPTLGQIDGFALAPLHIRLVQVSLQDQTDRYNELAWEREWLLHTSEGALALSGCLFAAEDVLSGQGLIFLKEAPLPYARPQPTDIDLEVVPRERRLTLKGEPDGTDYPVIVLSYEGGRFGRIASLQTYQRALRPYVPGRDGLQLSNTWGDRNRDGRINAEFLAQEIEAGARLGVDIVQIDDGWEVGSTSNSVRTKTEGGVWEGYYAFKDNFWTVNPERFPNGLEPLVNDAHARGIRFGLWFGPDSSGDFANWKRDADTIIDLHRTLCINYFKIDGVKVRTRTGERNLHAFFDHVLQKTAGKVVFDLDITAETRPGYFGLMQGGPLFVENRYTDWHRYWPHQTLRNLWKLAHYVDPLRLRMEWLNHTRNMEQYVGDPLAPAAYRPDYLFATVMFSSPLGWFEVSSLPESYFAEATPLIAKWKTHRERIFEAGVIYPIGSAPDGIAWTGFAAPSSEGGLYVLVFREASHSPDWQIVLPFAPDTDETISGMRIGGDGNISLLPGRRLAVSILESHRFLFAYIPL